MNGRKSQGLRKDSEQGSGRIPLQCSCSHSWDPSALCPLWSFRGNKTRIYWQKPIRGSSHLYPYCVRQGKTKGLTVLLFPLGFWRTTFILYSNCFCSVLLECVRLPLSWGADPIGVPAVKTADNWSRLVLRWQGGDGDLQDLKFTCKHSKMTFPWLGITLLPFSITLPADSWQTQLYCFQLQLPYALRKEEGRGARGRTGRIKSD